LTRNILITGAVDSGDAVQFGAHFMMRDNIAVLFIFLSFSSSSFN